MVSSRVSLLLFPQGLRRARFTSPGLVSFLVLVLCSSFSAVVSALDVRGLRSLNHQHQKLAHTEHLDSTKTAAGEDLQRFMEVARPILAPRSCLTCSMKLLYHEFANTYGVAPPVAQYTPSKDRCGKWDKVVLKWSAVCRGRQFDRIAAVWLGGVEILRTCTAEPTQRGIIWEIEKDVTRYSALWKKPQELVVAMGNVVDGTYTGIINVTVSVEFYREGEQHNEEEGTAADGLSVVKNHGPDWQTRTLIKRLGKPGQVILPIAESSYKDGGYWFQLLEEGGSKNASLRIPRNTYRAVLEVCLSPHQRDEFWYTNLPNDFLVANNLTDIPGNGAFREVQISLDGQVVGAVWPFAVLYTGGVNPLFWRPLAAIGAFNLPSYDIDITPFVGTLLDGKEHVFSFSVTDNLDMWLLQANLHIWTDPYRRSTSGGLESSSAPAVMKELDSEFMGLNGTFNTSATRSLSYAGHVVSSFGNLTTTVSYGLKFYNSMVLSNSSDIQTVDQFTETETTIGIRSSEKDIALYHDVNSYPLYLYAAQAEKSDGSEEFFSSLTHSLKTQKQAVAGLSSSFSSLTNYQNTAGFLFIDPNNTIRGIAATNQSYSYEGTDGCYQRDIVANNYTIASDKFSFYCSHSF